MGFCVKKVLFGLKRGFLLPNFQWENFSILCIISRQKSLQVKICNTLNLNSKVSHLSYHTLRLVHKGVKSPFWLKKGLLVKKDIFLPENYFICKKSYFFFLVLKKIYLGYNRDFLSPCFQGG